MRALLDAGRGTDAASAVMRLRQLPGDLGKGPAIDLAEAEAALAVSEFQRAAASAAAARDGAEKVGDAALARRAKLIHARTLMRLASPQESERRLAALFDEAEAAGDAALAAEALVVRAIAARRAALTEQAPALLAEGLERARALGLVRVEIEGMNSQGRFEGEAGKLEEGLATIERVARARTRGRLARRRGAGAAVQVGAAQLEGRVAGGVRRSRRRRRRACARRATGSSCSRRSATSRSSGSRTASSPRPKRSSPKANRWRSKLGTPIARAQIFRGRAYLQDMRGDEGGSRAAYRSAIEVAREAGLKSQLAVFLADYAWFEVGWEHLDAAEAPATRGGGALREAAATNAPRSRSARWSPPPRRCAARVAKARRHMERLRSGRGGKRLRVGALHRARRRVAAARGARRAARRRSKRGRTPSGSPGTFDSPSLVAAQQAVLLRLLEVAGRRDEARALARELLPAVERIGMADAVKRCRSRARRLHVLTLLRAPRALSG